VPPSSLRLLLYAAAAVAAGVLAGGAGALFLEGRARSWRGARDAELTLRAPVLGVIPDYSSVGEED
jgi:capsular polysaccharide biosynthesis protein